MGQTIGDLLPLAIGVAISPVPLIAVILTLFTPRARQNSVAFLIGWIAGIVVAMSILIAIASTQDLTTDGEPSNTASWVKLILGALLILGAVMQWRKRPAPGTEATMPGWMHSIDAMKPFGALGLALLLAAVNPKNLLLIAGVSIDVAQANLTSSEIAIAVAVFTVIGASTVAIPTIGYLILGARAQPALDHAKEWLAANTTAVMAVMFLVLGVSLFGKGLGALI